MDHKGTIKKLTALLAVCALLAGVLGACAAEPVGGPGRPAATTSASSIEYARYDVTELFDMLSGNALKAQNTFKGQYVELTGYLETIDSDGRYISVGADPGDYTYLLDSVHCTIRRNSGQLEQIMEMKTGDPITVRGRITDVGEVLGYYLDIDGIG